MSNEQHPAPSSPADDGAASSASAARTVVAPPAPAGGSGHGSGWRQMLGTLVVVLVILWVVRSFLVDWFVVPSESMEPGLLVGDRIVVDRLHGSGGVKRQDPIVFDGTTTFGTIEGETPQWQAFLNRALGGSSGTMYVKRVIGMPGDHVVCCDSRKRLVVNGTPLTETYLAQPSLGASLIPFDVKVPAGKIWVMGDNRENSADSRAHLGDPGGGMVPLREVEGRVIARIWPPSRMGAVPAG